MAGLRRSTNPAAARSHSTRLLTFGEPHSCPPVHYTWSRHCDYRLRVPGDNTEYTHPMLASGGGGNGIEFCCVLVDGNHALVPACPAAEIGAGCLGLMGRAKRTDGSFLGNGFGFARRYCNNALPLFENRLTEWPSYPSATFIISNVMVTINQPLALSWRQRRAY